MLTLGSLFDGAGTFPYVMENVVSVLLLRLLDSLLEVAKYDHHCVRL